MQSRTKIPICAAASRGASFVLRHGDDDRDTRARGRRLRFHAEAVASGSGMSGRRSRRFPRRSFASRSAANNDAKRLVLAALPELEAQAPSERIDALMTLIEADVSLGNIGEAERDIAAARAIADASGDRGAISEVIARGVTAAMSAQLFERAVAGCERSSSSIFASSGIASERRARSRTSRPPPFACRTGRKRAKRTSPPPRFPSRSGMGTEPRGRR